MIFDFLRKSIEVSSVEIRNDSPKPGCLRYSLKGFNAFFSIPPSLAAELDVWVHEFIEYSLIEQLNLKESISVNGNPRTFGHILTTLVTFETTKSLNGYRFVYPDEAWEDLKSAIT